MLAAFEKKFFHGEAFFYKTKSIKGVKMKSIINEKISFYSLNTIQQ